MGSWHKTDKKIVLGVKSYFQENMCTVVSFINSMNRWVGSTVHVGLSVYHCHFRGKNGGMIPVNYTVGNAWYCVSCIFKDDFSDSSQSLSFLVFLNILIHRKLVSTLNLYLKFTKIEDTEVIFSVLPLGMQECDYIINKEPSIISYMKPYCLLFYLCICCNLFLFIKWIISNCSMHKRRRFAQMKHYLNLEMFKQKCMSTS